MPRNTKAPAVASGIAGEGTEERTQEIVTRPQRLANILDSPDLRDPFLRELAGRVPMNARERAA